MHVKHLRLSAVLRAREAERKCLSYTVTETRELGGDLVNDTGLEPVTSSMSRKCSNQLS